MAQSTQSRQAAPAGGTASFTVLELLIVVGILGILGTVTIITLKPTELFSQARDANRVTEIQNINKAVQYYKALGNSNLGTANVVYISVPDTSPTCANFLLPPLPTGWSYACKTAAAYRNINGTGWIPLNFSNVNPGSPFVTLPIDPINSANDGLYYAYVNGGVVESWTLASLLQSEKYLKEYGISDGGSDPARYEQGNDKELWRLASGLAGYWSFDNNVNDSSGNNNNGTIVGSAPYVAGKINQAIQFGNGYVTVPDADTLDISNLGTVNAWVYLSATLSQNSAGLVHKGSLGDFSDESYSLRFGNKSDNPPHISFHARDTQGNGNSADYLYFPDLGVWHQITVTGGTNSQMTIYVDGLPYATLTTGANNIINSNGSLQIGCQLPSVAAYCFNGRIDEVRLYKRFMPGTEIKSLYEAGK